MIFIDAATVHRLLPYPALVDGLARMHRIDTDLLKDVLLEQPQPDGTPCHFFMRAGWQRGQAIGAKLVTSFPGNNRRQKLPAIQAIYLLFDGHNGKPQACVDGTALTCRKTAADSALGARFLARPDVRSLLMVGAGAMAPHLVMAHCAIRPTIDTVWVWNRSADKAATLADSIVAGNGAEVRAVTDLEAHAREADMISCATGSREPVIHGAWLKPGTHLDLVGAFTPGMREADDEALRRASLFVNSRDTTIGEIGELIIPIAAGVISAEDVLADHYDLCRNRHPGRRSAEEITLFKNGGGGHLDLMAARLAYERYTGGHIAD